MNSGQPPSKRKKTKPKLDIWVNFSYRDGDKRAVCLHCNKDVMKRADVIKLHLKSCASYQLILSTENDNTINQSSDANQSKSVSADVKKVPNTRMIESFFDKMDGNELDELQLMYAECVYANGLSFNSMSNQKWVRFFKRLRPNFKVPSREQLSNELLKKSYDRVSKLAVAYVEKSEFISIVIDGWSNVRKNAIINVVAMTPEPVFLESIDTKGAKKNVKYMFDIVEKAITKLGAHKVAGLISDNENKMIGLKNEVIKKYKHIVFNGCVSHQLSLLIQKMCNLSDIKTLLTDTVDIITEINNHDSLHDKFRDMIVNDRGRTFGELKLYSKTRFAGSVLMIKSVIKAINALRVLCADPVNNVSEATRTRILGIGGNENYVQRISDFHDLLNPICIIIHQIESDHCSIADMIEVVTKLNINADPFSTLTPLIKNTLENLTISTMKSIKTPSALLANILHPSYRGRNLSPSDKSIASNFLILYAKQLDMDKQNVAKSYQEYINGDHFFSNPFTTNLDIKKPISWWKFVRNMSDHGMLSQIALRLIHIQPTNTAVERTFSRQKFIHRKERNRLSSVRVNMLVFIHSNLNRFENDNDFDENHFVLESEPELEDESEEEEFSDDSDIEEIDEDVQGDEANE